ncbi:N-acetyllactosaminide beta-1,3-N-acetylglucosaminyltransferase 2 [Notolabrus celidotus]|uniref:N-acetyllactosaminide beta-1,3-N-acetylglucosaminyltransferase 2 n=1 Tax=Notolabrus celidotus TaxID=1203425 RepID=UPI00149064BB|nr:N-acetyllactosaminide beta-1,3-N-acetylglucosaminyltransferase 2 [Notolabrus celidotus]
MKEQHSTPHTACSSYLQPMRHIQTFSTMTVCITVFLIFFYSTLNLETSSSHKAVTEDHTELPSLQVQVQESTTVPQLKLRNVTVSDSIKQLVPQSGAYWNRLLHSALKNLSKGENPFRHVSDWSSCRVTNKELLKTNVHDFDSYTLLFQDFLESMDCRTPPVLINQPKKCFPASGDKEDNKLLLFAIKSRPAHFERRQAVRETWGQEGIKNESGIRVRTVFLMGSLQKDDPDLSSLLSFEAKHFGDILQWDFHDSFFNLTLKMSMFLEWSLKYCPHVTFVFSGDDDVFVNTPLLLSYLQSLDSSKASKLYSGHVLDTARPIRDSKSKYFVPVSFYDSTYPAYVGGGGFLISGALLEPLYSVSRVIPFYPIDDVYTGFCFMAIGVSPERHPGFHTFDIKWENRENLCVHKGLTLTHGRSPQQLQKLWRGINNPLLNC